MKCEICKKEMGNMWVVLPATGPNVLLTTKACLKCARESPVYCLKHEIPHLGFLDGTTACTSCVSELMAEKNPEVETIYNEIEEGLPPIELGRLIGWTEISGKVSGLPLVIYLLKAIATAALRLGMSFDEVKKQVLEAKSIDLLKEWE